MPSSPLGFSSSSADADSGRRSRFTYRHLAQLAACKPSSPLRVIAHIDLDAFYAQCEMVRLGVPEDKPLAVQQWQGLIAVNYAAREAGIGRHCNVAEAKQLCPGLIAQHVATWREGDDKWAYRDDAAANMASDKVSLDPYRLQSRRILALVKQLLPPDQHRVEKASIDEVFVDLSAHVHAVLCGRFPELGNGPPHDDAAEQLPLPSVAALDWQTDALVGLDDDDDEARDPDWDDVAILAGSEIVRTVRARIRHELGYTCSAGIANNKLLSKLGSGFNKPNGQTVIRTRAARAFLANFKLAKLRHLGGKLGDRVVSALGTDSVKDLLDVPLDRFKAKLGDDTALWLYETIRGVDTTQVNERTQIKSMLSAKSFRPTITTRDQAVKWLRIFVADIHARLVEEGVLDKLRRPRTINLHYRTAGQTRSRQMPIPQGKALDEDLVFQLAKELLAQIIADGRVWPCANLSLSVTGFKDGTRGNMGIGGFLVKDGGVETADDRLVSQSRSSKRPRIDDGAIYRFFSKESQPDHGAPSDGAGADAEGQRWETWWQGQTDARPESPPVACFVCARCKASFADAVSLQSHGDWHMAKDLQDRDRAASAPAQRQAAPRASFARGPATSSRRGQVGKLEQGQKKLDFG